jgi:hypothetical protein
MWNSGGMMICRGRLRKLGGETHSSVILSSTNLTKDYNHNIYCSENLVCHVFMVCFLFLGDMKFPEMNVKITPNTPQLMDIFPSSFKVCGHVAPYKLKPGAMENGPSSVALSKEGVSAQPIIAETQAETGEFCVFLEPGKYEGRVTVSEEEKIRGLQ